MAKAQLLVIQGVDQGVRFELGEEPAGIGRGVRNSIRILDTEVSRAHASIQNDGKRFIISDLNSSNGTFVNGTAVGTRPLEDGDQIQIGRTLILFSTKPRDESSLLADRVNFVGRHDPEDRSSIVGEVSRDAARELMKQPPPTGQRRTHESLTNLQTLYRISEEAVSPSISLDQLLTRILSLTIQVVGADRGCVLVADPQTGELVPQAFWHRRGMDEDARMPVSRTIVDYVLKNGQGVRTSDAKSDSRFEVGQSILQAGIREAMCVPMTGRYELLGAIYVDMTTPPEKVVLRGGPVNHFNEDQLRLLAAIARQAALAVENNRYQQALLKAERLAAVGQTIATLSHHIKNILQGVRGGSYLIDMGLNDHNEELIHKGWTIVEKNQNKIYNLVMDMLTFSAERKPSLRQASLNETVGDVCELMQARADESGLQFECELAEDLPHTTFDPEGIHRALLNIVTNALDAVEDVEGGTVRVETSFDYVTENMVITVTDNGPGISPDNLARVFNVFESTKGARGTGLGLAVSRKIIREHGGDITVESAPGEGCCFRLSWPRIDDDQRTSEEPTME